MIINGITPNTNNIHFNGITIKDKVSRELFVKISDSGINVADAFLKLDEFTNRLGRDFVIEAKPAQGGDGTPFLHFKVICNEIFSKHAKKPETLPETVVDRTVYCTYSNLPFKPEYSFQKFIDNIYLALLTGKEACLKASQ